MRNSEGSKIKTILSNVLFFSICLFIAYIVSTHLLGVVPIEGTSMEPTIHDEDKVLIFRKAKIKRGDIVVFDSAVYNKRLIKRVIALEGDLVEYRRNENMKTDIFINGEKLVESYIKDETSYFDHTEVRVPKNHFYYLGDNREVSVDSHSGVTDSLNAVIGKVILRYSSITNIEIIKNPFLINRGIFVNHNIFYYEKLQTVEK